MNRLFFLLSLIGLATAAQAQSIQDIAFTEETLPNGLIVIYAPLHQAPVVQVRVLYHVGSRDELPDRQGFAHMFEHMMFRGSAHVAPQEHMKLVDEVGGICNAFTSFDETVYHDTLPSEDLEMALYLEADRMSSFKVSDEIYKIERKVVAEEWRIQQNRPYGTLFEDYLKTAFTTHSYRWTPIGNMQHLLAAPVSELQDFYNTYYVPNNAVLVISGDIDVDSAKQMVQKYFAWIPRGADIHRVAEPEPPQTQPRSATMPDRVPLADVVIGWHIPPYKSDDQYALSVLGTVLGDGDSSRLHKLLVSNDHPLCVDASTILEPLEDGGVFGVIGTVMAGKDPKEVEKTLNEAVADVIAHGITEDELAKAKTLNKVSTIFGRQRRRHRNPVGRRATVRRRCFTGESIVIQDRRRDDRRCPGRRRPLSATERRNHIAHQSRSARNRRSQGDDRRRCHRQRCARCHFHRTDPRARCPFSRRISAAAADRRSTLDRCLPKGG